MTVQISGLPVAVSAADTDLLLMRQGLVDKQVQVGLIRAINIPAFAQLLSGAVATDAMLISRGGTNYQIRFAAVGIEKGTTAWFYQSAAPFGWNTIANTNGSLLAVRGPAGSTYTTAGQEAGTWQQTGMRLTLEQMPPHRHRILLGDETTDAGTGAQTYPRLAKHQVNVTQPARTEVAGGVTVGAITQNDPHNHGNTWRPTAYVGILCVKVE